MKLHWLCFLKVCSVWAGPGYSKSFFIVFGTKVSRFLIVPERPLSIQKHFGSEVC